jgi:hypothetical protein
MAHPAHTASGYVPIDGGADGLGPGGRAGAGVIPLVATAREHQRADADEERSATADNRGRRGRCERRNHSVPPMVRAAAT